jgi:hypothetical protein
MQFDKVFDPSASQREIFLSVAEALPSLLMGYNLTMFAYGQTGSGKQEIQMMR